MFSGDSSSVAIVASGTFSAVFSGESSFVSSTKGTGSDDFSSSATVLWPIDGVESAALMDVGVLVETFVAIGVVGGSVASSLLMSSFGS